MNILDLMVRHNFEMAKNNQKDKMLAEEEIVQDLILFLFAGLDTSFQTSSSCLALLTQHQDYQKKIR